MPHLFYDGRWWKVEKLACGTLWRFVAESDTRLSFTMNADQLIKAGLANVIKED